MKIIKTFLFFALLPIVIIQAQIGIGTITPDASSILDVNSSDKGILTPHVALVDVTDTTLDGTNPAATGLLIYNTNAAVIGGNGLGYYYFNGIVWERLTTSATSDDDIDWYEEGTTSSPNAITDDMFTFGNVAIGKNTANYSLDIFTQPSSQATRGINIKISGPSLGNITYGSYIENSSPDWGIQYGSYILLNGVGSSTVFGTFNDIQKLGGGFHHGSYNRLAGTEDGSQFGVSNYITNTGNGNHFGTRNVLLGNGASGTHFGTRNIIENSGNGAHYGAYSTLSGPGTGVQYGVRNHILNFGSNSHYGVYNELSGSGIGSQYGTRNYISNTGASVHYGVYNELSGTGNGTHHGTFNLLDGTGDGMQNGVSNYISNTGNGNHFGTRNVLDGNGSGIHFGTRNLITNSGSGTHYGVYSTLSGAGTGLQYGVRNHISNTGSNVHYGVYNELSGPGNGPQYGIRNYISNTGNSNHYGTYSLLSGTGNGTKMGIYSDIDITAGGTHYGVYSNVLKAGSYAGYFNGNLYMSNGRATFVTNTDASGTPGTGVLEIGNSLRIDSNEIITNTNSTLYLQNDNNGDLRVDANTLVVDASTNRVGIRTTTPDFNLNIKQSSNSQNSSGGLGLTSSSSTDDWKVYHSGSNLSFAENGVRRAYISAGSGVYIQTSDKRLKKELSEVEPILSKVMSLKTYRFLYKEQASSAKKTIGFMAQDIQLFFPELVETAEDGYFGLNYAGFGVLAIKAIQEQQEIIEKQQNEIDALKNDIQEIKALLINNK